MGSQQPYQVLGCDSSSKPTILTLPQPSACYGRVLAAFLDVRCPVCLPAASAAMSERSTMRLEAVHQVTAEEAAAEAFSIDQVVLPLPGRDVQYPGNAVAEVTRPCLVWAR